MHENSGLRGYKIRTRNLAFEVQAEVSDKEEKEEDRGLGNGGKRAKCVEGKNIGSGRTEGRGTRASRDSSRASLQQFVDNI